MSSHWQRGLPLTFLITLHFACLLGGFIAPNSAVEQNRQLPWAPPTKLRFVDADGRFHWRPFVYPLVEHPQQSGRYEEDTSQPYALRFFVEGDEYYLAGLFPAKRHLLGVAPPARLYFLGTDGVGRDVLARTLVGGGISLFAGLFAAGLALAVGTLVGVAAGYSGGRTDALLMRLAELLLSLPWLYLLLAIRAFLPLTLSPLQGFQLTVAVIGLLGWPFPARLIRGVVLSATAQPFVTASRSIGANAPRLLTNHVLPQTLPVLGTQSAILVPSYILAEVTLSFLGLGIADPLPSWGNLLEQLQSFHVLTNYHWMALPAIPLFATFLAYYILSRSLHHPRHARSTNG